MIAAATSLRLPYRDGTFHAALCSPPYWGGVRIYSGPQVRPWPAISYSPMPGLPPVEIPAQAVPLGHEADPFAYVGHLLMVYREVRRTMRPEAVLCVNLGDCYATGAGSAKSPGGGRQGDRWTGAPSQTNRMPINGLRSKNLLLMPWRLALAMQADGWILRSRMPGGVEIEPDILWKKNSTMPESVTDRPTKDFEDVLLFSQQPRYFWDQEAGLEAASQPGGVYMASGNKKAAALAATGVSNNGTGKSSLGSNQGPPHRNMRAVWTINPEPTDEEHFAAWPVELAARLIRVTTSERGCCPECGAPWERVVESRAGAEYWKARKASGEGPRHGASRDGLKDRGRIGGREYYKFQEAFPSQTIGWRATCHHDAEPVPCLVLDPFAGLGRTWEAARKTGRRFAGADLSLEYCWTTRSRNVLEAAARRRESEAKAPKTITGPLFAQKT